MKNHLLFLFVEVLEELKVDAKFPSVFSSG